MKAFVAIIGLLLLVGATMAQPVNEQVGPYKMSFTVPVPVSVNSEINSGEANDGTAYTEYKLTATNSLGQGAIIPWTHTLNQQDL